MDDHRLFHEINEVTGFANGDTFEDYNQLKEYFTVYNLHFMVGKDSFIDDNGTDHTPSQ